MPSLRSHPRLVDVLPALLLALMFVLEVVGTDQTVPVALALPVALAMSLPFAWRRRHPVVVSLVALAAFAIQGVVDDWELEPQTELLGAAFAFWVVGAHVGDPAAWRAGAAALALLVIHQPDDSIVMVPLMAGVFGAGRLMRSRAELARALERDRAEGERLAVAEERARIARELHDVVAHSIALMTVQAGGERLAIGAERPQTADALRQIEVTGRQALAEMRRLLGMIRSPGEDVELAPLPGIEQLPALAERVTRAGLHVDVTVEGQPSPVSPGVDISAYRIVQEGLTNALKHAQARSAAVRVVYAGDTVEVEVSDDGDGGPGVQGNGSGHGLTGMRERAALYGGTLEAGPRPGGGWALRARLPREPPA